MSQQRRSNRRSTPASMSSSSSSSLAMATGNTVGRRMFRGTGGATDRANLPDKTKLLAKRKPKKYIPRIPTEKTTTSTNATGLSNCDDEVRNDIVVVDDESSDYIHNSSNNNHDSKGDSIGDECQSTSIVLNETTSLQRQIQDEQVLVEHDKDCTVIQIRSDKVQKLLQRIGNVRRSIQNSSTATISQPSIYHTNVLLAVQNCCKLWSNIILEYNYHQHQHGPHLMVNTTTELNSNVGDNNYGNNNPVEWTMLATKTALQLFTLIQLSIQCGPLHGSKPAYIKRCGSDICTMVLHHLQMIQGLYYSNHPKRQQHEQKDNHNDNTSVQGEEGNVHVHTMNQLIDTCDPDPNVDDNDSSSKNSQNCASDDDDDHNQVGHYGKHSHNLLNNTELTPTDHSNTFMSSTITTNQQPVQVECPSSDNDTDTKEPNAETSAAADDDDDNDVDDKNDNTSTTSGSDDNHSITNKCNVETNYEQKKHNQRCWDQLYFTTKQIYAIEGWIKSCQKQVTIDNINTASRLPSRHIQKLQDQGQKNTCRNTKRRQKKQQKKIAAILIANKQK